jgi:choline dehydrogenase
VTGVRASRLLFKGSKITGIEAIVKGSGKVTYTCVHEIILSAGAIQTPQILLLSGIGSPEALRPHDIRTVHELPGVGQNLQDHVWTGVSRFTTIRTSNSYIPLLNQAREIFRLLLFNKGPLANSPLEANAFFHSKAGLDRPDLQLHLAPVAIAPDYLTDIYKLDSFSRRDGFGILAILIRPESRGYIGLYTADPHAPPLIQPRLLSDPRDMDVLLYGLRKAIDIAESGPFREFCPDAVHFPGRPYSDESLKAHIRRSLETLYHPVGTCKMGKDDMAVVDQRLRVHGLEGLRIADASIMPTIISGNTNATCIMIGEKASDLILEDFS